MSPKEVDEMPLWERVMLEAGLEWENEQAAPDESSASGTTTSSTLNLDALAEMGAEVS